MGNLYRYIRKYWGYYKVGLQVDLVARMLWKTTLADRKNYLKQLKKFDLGLVRALYGENCWHQRLGIKSLILGTRWDNVSRS